jgi:23S rRNA (cytidine1920-2'-O)/16S rRNA (cytidine1409-2'-O)-methyltransferase
VAGRDGREPGDRQRLDALLVEQGLARSRTEAHGLVLAGRVRVEGLLADKPGRRFPAGASIDVSYPAHRYASRGGLKLEKALDYFGLVVGGVDCLDVGASTGGFTDCLLTRGARRVYAVDVGYGLLAWRLRTDPRVVVLDRTNARHMERETFRRRATERLPAEDPEFRWPGLATCDVSFISLLKVVPAIVPLLSSPWRMVLLVKPQFEAGRERVGSGGVVRDPAVHVEVLERVCEGLGRAGASDQAAAGSGQAVAGSGQAAAGSGQAVAGSGGVPRRVEIAGLTYSPVRGPEGNIEYLLWVRETSLRPAPWSAERVAVIVRRAFEDL